MKGGEEKWEIRGEKKKESSSLLKVMLCSPWLCFTCPLWVDKSLTTYYTNYYFGIFVPQLLKLLLIFI